jgi:hypothetical protein
MKLVENTRTVLADSAQTVFVDPIAESVGMTRRMACKKRRSKHRVWHALWAGTVGVFTFPFRLAWKVVALPMHVYKKRQARNAASLDIFSEWDFGSEDSPEVAEVTETEELDYASATPTDFVRFGFENCGRDEKDVMKDLMRAEIKSDLISEGYRRVETYEDCGCRPVTEVTLDKDVSQESEPRDIDALSQDFFSSDSCEES